MLKINKNNASRAGLYVAKKLPHRKWKMANEWTIAAKVAFRQEDATKIIGDVPLLKFKRILMTQLKFV